jgi:hypothetical protein
MLQQMLLENVEIPFAHNLIENKIPCHPTHVLSSARTPIPLIVLPAEQKQKSWLALVSTVLYEINKVHDETSNATVHLSHCIQHLL